METIQGYSIIKKLGEGGFGETFLAEKNNQKGSPELSRRVVIKKLKLATLDRWKTVERFQREAAVLKALDHRGIPKYLDFIEAEDFLGIVQQYIPGRPWQELIDQQITLKPEEITDCFKQGLELLSYLQKQSVIHRDLKPGNIILDEAGKVWLIDFGSVRNSLIDRNSTVTTMGTFGYMAPEQIMGNPVFASDLYSFAHAMIALGNNTPIAELPRNLIDGTPDQRVLEQLPLEIRYTLSQMIKPGLQQRLKSAEEALECLKTGPKTLKKEEKVLLEQHGIKYYRTDRWAGYLLEEDHLHTRYRPKLFDRGVSGFVATFFNSLKESIELSWHHLMHLGDESAPLPDSESILLNDFSRTYDISNPNHPFHDSYQGKMFHLRYKKYPLSPFQIIFPVFALLLLIPLTLFKQDLLPYYLMIMAGITAYSATTKQLMKRKFPALPGESGRVLYLHKDKIYLQESRKILWAIHLQELYQIELKELESGVVTCIFHTANYSNELDLKLFCHQFDNLKQAEWFRNQVLNHIDSRIAGEDDETDR